MEKKSNSMFDVMNALLFLVFGALVIDFVMVVVCKFVSYNAYYREMRVYAIVAFEVLGAARFLTGKLGEARQTLSHCKNSFSWKSLLYFVANVFFAVFSMVAYANCIHAIIEPESITLFVYLLIALVVFSCISAFCFDGYLKESLIAQSEKEQKEKREVYEDDEDEQMVEIFVKGKDGTRVEKVPAKCVSFKRRNE